MSENMKIEKEPNSPRLTTGQIILMNDLLARTLGRYSEKELRDSFKVGWTDNGHLIEIEVRIVE